MSPLDELTALLGAPDPVCAPADWTETESHLGTALPGDYKAFVDAYGPGAVCDELVAFHPDAPSALLPRMRRTHALFAARRERAGGDLRDHPHPFHPEPGGLISWGYDPSGDEHFFLPCDPDPARWKIVTMVHEVGCTTFNGSFSAFVLAFVREWSAAHRYPGVDPEVLEFLEPDELEELVEQGEVAPPAEPRFVPS